MPVRIAKRFLLVICACVVALAAVQAAPRAAMAATLRFPNGDTVERDSAGVVRGTCRVSEMIDSVTQSFDVTMPGGSVVRGVCVDSDHKVPAAGMYPFVATPKQDGTRLYEVIIDSSGGAAAANQPAGCDLSPNQRIRAVWSLDGRISLVKTPSSPVSLAGASGYSLDGAVYGVYSDAACITRAGQLRTGLGGASGTLTLSAGEYWVKEEKPSAGFALDASVHHVIVNPTELATVSSVEPAILCEVELVKESAEPRLTDGNPANSLAGAVYGVFRDSAMTQRLATLTTTSTGRTNKVRVAAGPVFVKEESPSPGYGLDPETYVRTLRPGDVWRVGSTEPVSGGRLRLTKRSAWSGTSTAAHDFSDTLVIGDSVMAACAGELRSAMPGVDVDASPGRTYDANGATGDVGFLATVRQNPGYGHYVIQAGMNDSGLTYEMARGLADMASAVGARGARVLFVNQRVTSNEVADELTDESVRRVVSERSNVSVVDWRGAVSGHESEYLVDVCHPNGAGAGRMASLVKGMIRVSGEASGDGFAFESLSNYTLSGAIYDVYRTASDARARTGRVASVTVRGDEDASSAVAEIALPTGAYVLRERMASAGFRLSGENDEVEDESTYLYSFEVASGRTTDVDVTEVPLTLASPDILKVDADLKGPFDQGNAKLAGCVLKVDYYDGLYKTVAEAQEHACVRTWSLEVARDNSLAFDDAHKVAGDDFFLDDAGATTMPLGTYVVHETRASEGYMPTTRVLLLQATSDGWVRVI